jgi:hypothetical protein
MPGDSYLPLLLALAMTALFVSLLLHLWWELGIAALLTLIVSVAWLWPERALSQIET